GRASPTGPASDCEATRRGHLVLGNHSARCVIPPRTAPSPAAPGKCPRRNCPVRLVGGATCYRFEPLEATNPCRRPRCRSPRHPASGAISSARPRREGGLVIAGDPVSPVEPVEFLAAAI